MPEHPRAGTTVVVHACIGETPGARLAQDIAERVRTLVADGLSDTRAIAIDGCGAGCASRRLTGQGLEVEPISLEALGVPLAAQLDEAERDAVAHRIADRLRSRSPGARGRAPLRRLDPPSPGAASTSSVHSVDDYLFAISLLTSPVGDCGAVASDVPILSAHVARALGVSRATAGEMLTRIEAVGLVERRPDKTFVLTPAGRDTANRVVARHRVVERFLTDLLGYTSGESHTLALGMRGSLPDDVIDRIRRLVAPAASCPHGWPLEPGTGVESAPDLASLSALPPGAKRHVVALAEHDGSLLARLCELGLSPDVSIEVVSSGEAPVVAVDGARLALTPREAAAVFVLLSPRP